MVTGRIAVSLLPLIALITAVPVLAQSSTSFRISDHVMNAGGHPDQGTVMSSASFRVGLDSIGEGVTGIGLSGPSFHSDGSFGSCYPPAGEVHGLRFASRETMNWDAEKSVGTYSLYRGLITGLSSLGYGTCFEKDLTVTTGFDPELPPTADGWYYLVTAENRLTEEGTKGVDSLNTERGGTPCP